MPHSKTNADSKKELFDRMQRGARARAMNHLLGNFGITTQPSDQGGTKFYFNASVWTHFDLYQYTPLNGVPYSSWGVLRLLFYSTFIHVFNGKLRLTSNLAESSELQREEQSQGSVTPRGFHCSPRQLLPQRTGEISQGIWYFVGVDQRFSTDEAILSKIAFLSPLKWIEFILSTALLLGHFFLTQWGYLVEQEYKNEKENSSIIKKFLLIGMLCMAGTLRAIFQLTFGTLVFIMRSIATPLKLFHDCHRVHCSLGFLSAMISSISYGLIALSSPFWLPPLLMVMGISSLIGGAVISFPTWAPTLIGIGSSIISIGIMTSGLTFDLFSAIHQIVAYRKIRAETHPAIRLSRYEENPNKRYKDMALAFFVAAPFTLAAAVLGFFVGLVEHALFYSRGQCYVYQKDSLPEEKDRKYYVGDFIFANDNLYYIDSSTASVKQVNYKSNDAIKNILQLKDKVSQKWFKKYLGYKSAQLFKNLPPVDPEETVKKPTDFYSINLATS